MPPKKKLDKKYLGFSYKYKEKKEKQFVRFAKVYASSRSRLFI